MCIVRVDMVACLSLPLPGGERCCPCRLCVEKENLASYHRLGIHPLWSIAHADVGFCDISECYGYNVLYKRAVRVCFSLVWRCITAACLCAIPNKEFRQRSVPYRLRYNHCWKNNICKHIPPCHRNPNRSYLSDGLSLR